MPKFNFDPNTDATAVLDRIIQAYGFGSKLLLAQHFEMAASSLSSRYKRAIFPADMVIKCVSETGVSLEWLATGQGKKFDDDELDILKLPNNKLIDGKLYPSGYLIIDKAIFTVGQPIPSKPICLLDGKNHLIIDRQFDEVYDGKWLIEIDGKISIRELTRMPMQRVRVSGVGMAFDCTLKELEIIGRVVTIIENQ